MGSLPQNAEKAAREGQQAAESRLEEARTWQQTAGERETLLQVSTCAGFWDIAWVAEVPCHAQWRVLVAHDGLLRPCQRACLSSVWTGSSSTLVSVHLAADSGVSVRPCSR